MFIKTIMMVSPKGKNNRNLIRSFRGTPDLQVPWVVNRPGW